MHDDNARPYQAWMTTEYLAENRIESYQNPSYSPDLSPCNFFLITLETEKSAARDSIQQILEALDHAISYLTKADFQNCFDDCFSRVQKCVDVGGEYFEKIN